MSTELTPHNPNTPAQDTPESEKAKAWANAVKEHLEAMKYREQEFLRQSDDARLKAHTINNERMKLETLLYKEGLQN